MGAEMTFIQLIMEEGGRGRDQVRGGGSRGGKGQRKEHGHVGVDMKGRTWGRVDTGERGQEGRVDIGRVDMGAKGLGHQGHTRVPEACWSLGSP